ncbi:MAG: hypothetical protein AB7H80_05740 [Candidatus Kapaibacterium sp.]
MKRIKTITQISALAFALTIAACSESTSPDGSGRVTMQAQLSDNLVAGAMLDDKGVSTLGKEVDSITVSRVRILITEVKLHDKDGDDNDSNTVYDKNVKTGPIVIDATADSVKVFLTEPIPVGSYDKVKFEFHRFSGSEAAQYSGDPVFGDFVQDDRWSVIVEGMSYEGGQATPFTYRSDVTANLSLKFPDQITVADNETVTLIVEVDPIAVFKSGGAVLNPADTSNESKIDNAIKDAIKALKK